MNSFLKFLKALELEPSEILELRNKKVNYVPIDLSESNALLTTIDVSSSKAFSLYINDYLKTNNAQVAYGGYLEIRTIYKRSSHFNHDDVEVERNLHLGLDLWCEAGTTVLAVLDGEIHSFKNNTNYGDYGPTIVLKHTIDGVVFYTLYGHLSLESLIHIKVGDTVEKGKPIGTLGTAEVNGDYPPHLHFQIIKDLQGFEGDYPGVCNKKDLDFYKMNCPNPSVLLKLD